MNILQEETRVPRLMEIHGDISHIDSWLRSLRESKLISINQEGNNYCAVIQYIDIVRKSNIIE